jgi:myo-inositol-1(or 4)-monophosphatase
MDPSELDRFLLDLVPRLADMARRGFDDPGPVRFKSKGQAVTAVDGAVERVARDAILGAFPDHAVLGEEGGWTEGTADVVWYVDPIDGTTNFSRGIPFFSISIGVIHRGRPVVGHVVDPLRGEHFRGVDGKGAWLGEERIAVSEAAAMDQANVTVQSTAGSRFVRAPGAMLEIHRRFQKTRKFGSIALELAYVACGRLDFLLAGEDHPQPWWDIAGGWKLVDEAGGKVVDLAGNPVTPETTHFMAGNPVLVAEVLGTFPELAGGDEPGPPDRRLDS